MLKTNAYGDLQGLECLNSSQRVDQKDLLGRVVLYFFFRESDVLSKSYFSRLLAWVDHYKRHLVILGVYTPKFPAEAEREYVEKVSHQYDIRFPILLDSHGQLKKIYGTQIEPGFVLFDTQGRRRSIGSGNTDMKALHESIVSLINAQLQLGGKFPPSSILLERGPDSHRFLRYPEGICYHKGRDLLFVSDTGHSRIVVSDRNARVQYVIGSGERGDEDGDIKNSKFHSPQGMCVLEDLLFVADAGSHKIKCIDLSSGMVRSLVGTGSLGFFQTSSHKGKRISLSYPTDVKVYREAGKSYLLISNSASYQILKYDLEEDRVDLFLGNGRAKYVDDDFRHAGLFQTTSLMTDIPGFVFMNDSGYSSIRLAHNEKLKTVSGGVEGESGDHTGESSLARYQGVHSLCWDGIDKIFISDSLNAKVKWLSLKQKKVQALPSGKETLDKPTGMCYESGNLYVVDSFNHKVVCWNEDSQSWQDFTFHFAEKMEDSKESVASLPKLSELKLEDRVYRSQMRSVDIELEVSLPMGLTLNPETNSWLLVYEKHITHWYIVRKIRLSEGGLKLSIPLHNVGQTDHYVVDLRLNLCREGAPFENQESSYRLHIEHDPKTLSKSVVWKVKAQR